MQSRRGGRDEQLFVPGHGICSYGSFSGDDYFTHFVFVGARRVFCGRPFSVGRRVVMGDFLLMFVMSSIATVAGWCACWRYLKGELK